jgi:nucleoid DNA-binding protein
VNRRELLQTMVNLGAGFGEARQIYESTLGSLAEQLVRFAFAEIPGVGSFSVRYSRTPPRPAVNPFTRQPYTFPGRETVLVRYAPDSALIAALTVGAPPVESLGYLHRAFVAELLGRYPVIRLSGVGVFQAYKTPATRARLHPRTGAIVAPARPAGREVRFSAATQLKQALLPSLRAAYAESS